MNFFKGPYGDYMQKLAFLDEPSNIKRNRVCRFMWANQIGDYDPLTNRYDGAIGLLTEGKADVLLRPVDIGSIGTEFVVRMRLVFDLKLLS